MADPTQIAVFFGAGRSLSCPLAPVLALAPQTTPGEPKVDRPDGLAYGRSCMYKIVLDADGLIKIYKAGFLQQLTAEYVCLLPEEVYQEAIVAARIGHADEARALEHLIAEENLIRKQAAHSRVADRILRGSHSLGMGESGAVRLFLQEGANVLLTDDQAFLSFLTRHRIPFLTPSDALLSLRTANRLSYEDAARAAEQLRPLIRRNVYEDLRTRLESLR